MGVELSQLGYGFARLRIVTNGEPRSARPRRVEPRQVDFSVAATDMANSLDPEAGRRRAGLRVGRHRPRRQHPGTDTENGEKAGRCLKRSDLAAPEHEAARHDSREREEPVALECRQVDSPWTWGAQAAPTERRIKVRGRFDGVAERQADSASVERFPGRVLSGRGGFPPARYRPFRRWLGGGKHTRIAPPWCSPAAAGEPAGRSAGGRRRPAAGAVLAERAPPRPPGRVRLPGHRNPNRGSRTRPGCVHGGD